MGMRLNCWGGLPVSTRNPGAPLLLTLVQGDGQSVGAGLPVPILPAVRVTNTYGEPVSGFAVTFSGDGVVTGGSAVTDAAGVATVGSWTPAAGPNTLTAVGVGLLGSPVVFTATGQSINLDDAALDVILRRPWVQANGLYRPGSDELIVPSGGGGSAFDFFADWRAGDTTDGGKLVLWGGGPAIAVVSASGLGMPASMANVLQVALGTGNFDWAQANNAWTVPAIGGWRYFRKYIRLVVGAVSGGFAPTHPMESEGGSTSVIGAYYALHVGSNTDLSFPWMLDIGGFGGQWTTPNWTGSAPGTLTQSVTYRIEWGFLRTATSTYTIDMRIYGADDSTLLHDKNDLEWWGQSSGNMASAGGGQNIDTAHMEDLRFGINGGAIPSGNLYYGGFATRLGSAGDWCGPHTSNG